MAPPRRNAPPTCTPRSPTRRSRRGPRETWSFARYAPDTMIVFDVDLGHTDPQVVIPVGGPVEIDGPDRATTVTC